MIRDLDLFVTDDLKFPYLSFKRVDNEIVVVKFKVRWNGVEESKVWQITDKQLLK